MEREKRRRRLRHRRGRGGDWLNRSHMRQKQCATGGFPMSCRNAAARHRVYRGTHNKDTRFRMQQYRGTHNKDTRFRMQHHAAGEALIDFVLLNALTHLRAHSARKQQTYKKDFYSHRVMYFFTNKQPATTRAGPRPE